MQRNQETEQRDDLVIGRGAVGELLASGRPVECIYLKKEISGPLARILAAAKKNGIPCKEVDAAKLGSLCPGANHQGVVAQLAAASYCQVDDILHRAYERNEAPFLLIADGVEDPHNLGAIIRTAEAAGVHGLIIPKRRSAGLSYTVAKTSAGASAHLPVARVANLATTMEALKKQGVWIYAADFGAKSWDCQDYSGPAALVVGAEGSGISRLVREKCDFLVSLPMYGNINSLNVSVACGIILYEMARQRHLKQ